DFLPSSSKGASHLTYELAETAAQEAVSEAGLDSGGRCWPGGWTRAWSTSARRSGSIPFRRAGII
ncbi:hypothetical protein EN867_33300, partial [Mesorhizobium sp. M2D.F.Ca.ET.224.01.1.1]